MIFCELKKTTNMSRLALRPVPIRVDLSLLGLRPVPFWVGWNRIFLLCFFNFQKIATQSIFVVDKKFTGNIYEISFFILMNLKKGVQIHSMGEVSFADRI